MKKEKRKPKKINKTMFVDFLVDFKGIEDDSYLITKKGYIAVIRIDGVDIFGYKDGDRNTMYEYFATAERNLCMPHKYVFTQASPDYQTQKKFINYKISKQSNENLRKILERQLRLYKSCEETSFDKVAYLMIFSSDRFQLQKVVERFVSDMQQISCEQCKSTQLICFLSNTLTFEKPQESDNLLEKICPEELEFHSTYFKTDKRFVTSLIAYVYPEEMLDLQLANLFAMRDIIFTLDLKAISKTQSQAELKRSLDELNSRQVINNGVGDSVDDTRDLSNLAVLYSALTSGKEQMFSMTLRCYVYADTLNDLQAQIDKVKKVFNNVSINLYRPVNLMQQEFMALLHYDNPVRTPIPLEDTLSRQYPFYYQNFIDENGLYFGETSAGGNVILDIFSRSNGRKSYDMMLFGMKGCGKSVTLKTMAQDMLAIGTKVMVLDIEDEYSKLAEQFGGKVINLGQFPAVNPLEIRKLYTSDDAEYVSNFVSELSRIVAFLYQYVPSMTDNEAEEFKSLLKDTYKQFHITETTDTGKLIPSDFPIFSDLLNVLRSVLYEEYHDKNNYKFSQKLTQKRIETLQNIETYLKNLAEDMYSSMFNGYSSIDISKENFVVFNMKKLSSMDEKVYNAQLFNILSYMWQEICNNADINKNITNEYDRHYVIAIMDEAHRFINTKNPQALEFIEKLTRRTRKYDSALWLATQSLRDLNPSESTEHSDTIKTILNNITYRVIMAQSEEVMPLVSKTFQQFNDTEIEACKKFKAGEMLISISGSNVKLRCRRVIFNEDLYYSGNSRDKIALDKQRQEA